MALARLALRNLSRRISFPAPTLAGNGVAERSSDELLKRFMTTTTGATGETSDGKEVSVAEGGKKSKLFPKKRGKKSLWRGTDDREFVPALSEFFPSGLGNALLQATENINRLFQRLDLSPANLIGQVKEQEECYKLRYEVPGLSKEDLKIKIDDGVLTIKGEHKEEEEEGSGDDEFWSARRTYGYYNTSLLLPEDSKVDDIKAELKNGVLFITIPRTEKPKRDEKEIPIH